MSTMDHLIMFWSLFFSQYCLRFYLLFWLPLNSNLAATRNHLQLPQIWNPDEGTQLILYSDHFPLYYLYSAWSVRVWVLWQILNPFALYIFKGIVLWYSVVLGEFRWSVHWSLYFWAYAEMYILHQTHMW